MRCISCGEKTRYNRALVDIRRRAPLGGYCRACEKRRFGTSLQEQFWGPSEGCTFCDRPAYHALAEHHIDFRMRAGREHREEGYGISERSPKICPHHLSKIATTRVLLIALAELSGGDVHADERGDFEIGSDAIDADRSVIWRSEPDERPSQSGSLFSD
jgi:hypothetical protein